MKCPVDGRELVMAERSGVEIDYCPDCRGVWLDRGELDKIIERSAPAAAGRDDRAGRSRHDDRDDRDDRGRHYRKKRESFLSELFDF